MSDINRYDAHDSCEQVSDGDYVKFSDHEAEVARLRAEVECLTSERDGLIELANRSAAGVREATGEYNRLRAEVEKYRKDAARWRFIASAPGSVTLRIHNTRADGRGAAIDAAMGGH